MDALDGLPPLYAGWVKELLGGPVPEETEATCDRCVMVTSDPASGFHPDTKCCTFLPELHNYLVGAILADDDPAAATGRATVRERIAKRVAVTPLGLGRPRSYLMLYDHGGNAVFGRSSALRCPHYDNGGCGVWRHRESTCSTWFCKHVRGEVGRAFWKTLHRLLVSVERQVSWWVVAELGLDPATIVALISARDARRQPLDASELDGREPAGYKALWGSWVGREEELYRACAERVATLRWADVLAIGGGEARAFAGAVRANHAALLSTTLPDRLQVRAFRLLGLSGDTCRIQGYSEYDTIELPAALLDVLRSFDGRPRDVVVAELAESGVAIEDDLLLRLVDLGVLAEHR